MNINYNNWFYQFHQYLTGTRNGNVTYNDTNWVTIGERYEKLIQTSSHLMNEQPYGVVANDVAFDKLLELMERSNYAFEDINDALIETYQNTLRGAMSRMVVNTHNVIAHYQSTDKENVYADRMTQHYVIEVPFDQMHFGERDEFIRQKIQKMHNTSTNLYIPIHEFLTDEIVDILGFTIICTANGFICNDCYVAMSEKGLRFRINWNHAEDADFIIYKLDECYVCETDIDMSRLTSMIPMHLLPEKIKYHVGQKCILNIYDKNYISTEKVCVNFGELKNGGLVIHNLQEYTKNMLNQHGTQKVTIGIYFIKYLHEVPNVYPAINYYDILDSRRVLSDKGNELDTIRDNRVVMQSENNINALEICTPPICIDRPIDLALNTLVTCLNMQEYLMSYTIQCINPIVNWIQSFQKASTLQNMVVDPADTWYKNCYKYYSTYVKCATITSLIPVELIQRFRAFVDYMDTLRKVTNISQMDAYMDYDDLYGYGPMVAELMSPFTESRLDYLRDIGELNVTYYADSSTNRFNRPVSEQSFIAFRYDRDDACWLFCDPKIQHFHGIGNTFYINDGLNGDELFKFFVLYSDTDAPDVLSVNDEYSEDLVLDFDLFSSEVEKHRGFIRYWNAENKLMKLSRILTHEYSQEKTVEVLAKILKRKMEGFDILDEYGSDMIYTEATSTSLNVGADDDELAAPFTINYLFYTLAFMHDNEDKLQAFFYRTLTNHKFDARYVDLDVTKALKEHGSFPVNLSRITQSPNRIHDTTHMTSDGKMHMYYGLPMLFNNTTSQTAFDAYRYTFTQFNSGIEYPCVTNNNTLDREHYLTFSTGNTSYDFTTDAMVARYLTFYLTSLRNYINELQTNYKVSFNQTSTLKRGIEQIQKQINELQTFVAHKIFLHEDTEAIVDSVINNNAMIQFFNDMLDAIHRCLYFTTFYNGRPFINDSVNLYLNQLQKTFQQTGFDQISLKRIRNLYVHLKKINHEMTLSEYEDWWNGIDGPYIEKEIKLAVSNNPNVVQGAFDFDVYGGRFVSTREAYALPGIARLRTLMESLDTLKETHLAPIEAYCSDVINHYIFDFYTIKKVEFASRTFDQKPAYVTIQIPNDNHTRPPIIGNGTGSTVTLYFVPSVSYFAANTDQYSITDLRPITEYAFFDKLDITQNVDARVYSETGALLNTLEIGYIAMCKVGSSSDTTPIFNQIPNVFNTKVDIQNVHESFEVVNNEIVNQKATKLNYELLYGNQFTTLEHHPEWLSVERYEISDHTKQGPIDRIYMSNYMINRMALVNYGTRNSQRMYFKPSQILHIPIDEYGKIRAFGGGNFVGQRIYLSTNDTDYIFPATVTCIDHSQQRGILEAKVESRDAKWLEIKDSTLINRYLTSDIKCQLIPDNIRNFLDEFSNPNYGTYFIPKYDHNIDPSDPIFTDMYSLPGDPIFVEEHPDFVYTRLSYFFHELVPNRFIDEEHKMWRFMYMGYRDFRYDIRLPNNDAFIRIQCINHNFNPMSDPEKYPVLRQEPDDHGVYLEEKKVFVNQFDKSKSDITKYNNMINQCYGRYANAKTEYDRQMILNDIHTLRVKVNMAYEKSQKLQFWSVQREPASTWYNVYSHDAAKVYIDNGRADPSVMVRDDIRDIPWSDNLHAFLYDWENHTWIDPSWYSFEYVPAMAMGLDNQSTTDNPDHFKTHLVLKSLMIKPTNTKFPKSKRILIYFAYNTSDLSSQSIPDLKQTCDVRFKPILSLNKDALNDDPYAKLYLRKHFDVDESYVFEKYNAPDTFSNHSAYYITRYRRSGKHVYSPSVRMCDVSVINNNQPQEFDLYVKIPFPNISTHRPFKIPAYRITQYQPMDDFVPNQRIRFICIQNRLDMKYDGNISNIMFEGFTGDTIDDPITIKTSTLTMQEMGTFVCTVFSDTAYKSRGGIYTIEMTTNPMNLMDSQQHWIRIPQSIGWYKEIPNEFIIVPKNTISGKTTVSLKATYTDDSSDTIDEDNTQFNPFEYYFDYKRMIRYPISKTPNNDYRKRLVINQRVNTYVNLVKSNYIGICRYSLGNIPKNGFIDVSGYIPTPLSRTRYEFWVNGRYIKHPDDLVILSPTTFQLRNLKSLHNFELIELVDDVDDNDLMKRGNVYIATNGKAYTTYERALMSNLDFRQQNLQYTFYGYPNHTNLQDYIGDIKPDPNNRDIETNILSYLKLQDVSDYNDIWNVPSINGVDLYHLTTTDLGIEEVPSQMILDAYDNAWKREILTNPFFPMSHSDGSMRRNNDYNIYVRAYDDERDGMPNIDTSNMFVIYTTGSSSKYQSLYISTSETALISDTSCTLKIIPFVKNGTKIYIDQKYDGMWVHSTDSKYQPKQIQS